LPPREPNPTLPPPHRQRAVALLVVATLALAVAATALAEKPRLRLTSEGQAAARVVVLKRSDFTGGGWKGGMTKPDLSSGMTCPKFNPKQSDLTVVGASASEWAHTSGLEFDTQVQVMETARMLELDWQRTVLSPAMLPCMRTMIAKEVSKYGVFVSVRRVPFPSVTSRVAAFRVVVDVGNGSNTRRVIVDAVLIGRGRTEITLTAIAPTAAASAVGDAEVRLARVLASRAA
jgi:hypothetical protein